VRFGPGIVIKGDVTLENPAGKAMDDYVTITNRTYDSGSHKVEAVPAEAPAAAPALQPAMA
jgi:hypothetical protein